MLGAHLIGLNTHLANNHIQVSPVTMSTDHDNRLESSIGSEAQQRNARSEEHEGGEKAHKRASKRIEQACKVNSLPVRDDQSRYRTTSLRVGANEVRGMHVSLVA